MAGKADWTAFDLPTEGKRAGVPRITAVARRDVARCRLEETVGQVRERAGDSDLCVVVNDQEVVLGVVRAEALGLDADRPIAEVMQEGPTAFRPNLGLAELGAHLRKRGTPRVLITRSNGTLIGLVRLEDVPNEAEDREGA